MTRVAKTSDFYDVYTYKGHFMVNDPIEDDEGFYKNWYQWATNNHNGTITVHKEVPNTSSYTSWTDAVNSFKSFVDSMENK